MVRTSETMGHATCRAGLACPANRLRFSLTGTQLGTGQRVGMWIGLRAGRHRLNGVACSVVSVTLALPSPPSTAGWGLNVIEMFIAVPASANLSAFRHIVVLVGEFLDWRQFSRREIITDGLQRLLKGELMRRLTRHQKRRASLTPGSSVTLISRS